MQDANGQNPRHEDVDSTFSGSNATDSGHGSNDGESEAPKSPAHIAQPLSSPYKGVYAQLSLMSQYFFFHNLFISGPPNLSFFLICF